MKKLLFLCFLCGLSALLSAQDLKIVYKDSIVFEKTVHDFGTLQKYSEANCEFIFTNKGNIPLVLNQVHPVCGCTEAEWPKDTIPPGGKGVIKVKYNTQLTGEFSKAITVSSTAINSMVILVVSGNVLIEEEKK